MLLEFKCKNHNAIKDETRFLMSATSKPVRGKDRLMEVNHMKNIKFLKISGIFGDNCSGKSTLISAINYMKRMVLSLDSRFFAFNGEIQRPNIELGKNVESNYSMQFEKNNIRYYYEFEIKNDNIIGEYLCYFPNGKKATLFDRENNKISMPKKLKKYMSNFKVYEKEMFLSNFSGNDVIKPLKDAYDFFDKDLIIYNKPLNHYLKLNHIIGQMNSDPVFKNRIISALQELDIRIKDINIVIDTNNDQEDAIIVYDKFSISIRQESLGFQKLVILLGLIINAMTNNKVLIVDDIDIHLHEITLFGLLNSFIKTEYPNRAQLIFTTHCTPLLYYVEFRQDEIWFSDILNRDKSNRLYSLSDFKNITLSQDFEKGYLAGRYGAVPIIAHKIYDHVLLDEEDESDE